MKSKTNILSTSTLPLFLVTLLSAQTSFAAGRETKPENQSARDIKTKITQAEELRIEQVAQRLEISTPVAAEFVKSETKKSEGSVDNSRALMDLIGRASLDGKRSITASDVESADLAADTLSGIIRLKTATQGKFHLGLSDLVEINKSWSKEQKTNFNAVLRRASELSEKANREGRKITSDEAFTKALEEAGLLEKYNQGCRR